MPPKRSKRFETQNARKLVSDVIPKTLIQYQDNDYRQKESFRKTGKTWEKKI